MSDERVSNLSLQKQILALAARMDQVAHDIAEIKSILHELDARIRKLENDNAGSRPLMEARIDAAWKRIDEHDQRLRILERIVERLEHANRVMAWIGGILGSTVIVWLLSQILGLL